MIILRMYYERAIAYIKLHKAYKKERLEKPLLDDSIDFQLFAVLLFEYIGFICENYSPSVLSAAFMLSFIPTMCDRSSGRSLSSRSRF